MKAIAWSKIFSYVEGRNWVQGCKTFCILNQNRFSCFEFPIACSNLISWIKAHRSYFCDYFNNNSLLDTKIKNHKWILSPFFIFYLSYGKEKVGNRNKWTLLNSNIWDPKYRKLEKSANYFNKNLSLRFLILQISKIENWVYPKLILINGNYIWYSKYMDFLVSISNCKFGKILVSH